MARINKLVGNAGNVEVSKGGIIEVSHTTYKFRAVAMTNDI